jgi:serine/threonine protein kinase
VLRTVGQFHAQGVVIRDVKPENFLFATPARDSHLKAIDFGIAQYCGPSDTLTERAGTPIYVAPGAPLHPRMRVAPAHRSARACMYAAPRALLQPRHPL